VSTESLLFFRPYASSYHYLSHHRSSPIYPTHKMQHHNPHSLYAQSLIPQQMIDLLNRSPYYLGTAHLISLYRYTSPIHLSSSYSPDPVLPRSLVAPPRPRMLCCIRSSRARTPFYAPRFERDRGSPSITRPELRVLDTCQHTSNQKSTKGQKIENGSPFERVTSPFS